MKFNPPRPLTFWLSVLLAAAGLAGYVLSIPLLQAAAFWLVLAAYCLLVAGLLMRGI